MASLSQVTQTGIEVEIDGAKHVLSRVTLYDLAEIEEQRKAKAKQQADLDGKASGLTSYDIYNVKLDIEAREMEVSEWLRYARTPKGAQVVLNKSLAKSGKSADEAEALIGRLDPSEAVEYAYSALIHNQLRMAFDQAAKAGADDAAKNSQGASDTPTVASPADTTTTAGSTSTTAIGTTPTKDDDTPKGFGD